MRNGQIDIHLIDLGGDVGEVKLVEWHVAVGDSVKRGDLIYTVESDKVAIEVESEHDGVVETMAIEPGALVSQSQLMMTLRS